MTWEKIHEDNHQIYTSMIVHLYVNSYITIKMNRILLCLFVGLSTMSVQASSAMLREMFLSMPDSVLPLVAEAQRRDCIDFYEKGMKAESFYASAKYSHDIENYDTAKKQLEEAEKANPSSTLQIKINDLKNDLKHHEEKKS